jgi:hypothetical protein
MGFIEFLQRDQGKNKSWNPLEERFGRLWLIVDRRGPSTRCAQNDNTSGIPLRMKIFPQAIEKMR